jgi:hypothetical protein
VTVVAIDAVVYVSADPIVICICLRLRMTVSTLKDCVVTRIGVASRTYTIGAAMAHGEPGVTEGCIQPTGGGVTCPAAGWESGNNVVRTGRALVSRLVARIAICGSARVVVVYVALGAWNTYMRSGQRKSRVVMVERRWDPGRRSVANVALLWKSCGYMVRIGGASVVLNMARHASCRRALELASEMARRAVQLGMHSGQGVSGQFQMIKFGAEPSIDCMTLLAGRRESSGHVTGSSGVLVGLRVTGVALEGKTLELSNCCAFVACVAIKRRVCSDQRKPVLVVLNGSYRYHPVFHAVTLSAVRPHLSAMNIGVTIRAPCARVREDWLEMALATGDPLVRAKQRKSCLVVVEFRDGPNRLPSIGSMAVLARDTQAAMRASRHRIIPRLPQASNCTSRERKNNNDADADPSR